MGPGEQDEFQLEHDVGVGDVEVVLEVCRWKECAKLENRCEKGTHTHTHKGSYIPLHVFLACCDCTVAEPHTKLCGGGVDVPGGEVCWWEIVGIGVGIGW